MLAIIIKELRENVLWAMLGALALTGGLGWFFYSQINGGYSIVAQNLQMVSLMAFAVAGFALGVTQIMQDTRRGRWGFVIHRPISRWNTFAAKAVAGAVLYLLAATPAVVVLVLMARRPTVSHAPFAWDMIIPLLFCVVAGMMWYAGGMMVGSRRASWFGSRLFPAAGGIIVMAVIFGFSIYFLEAVAYTAIGAILLLIAAAAFFVHNGEYEPQPMVIKPLQVILVGIGVGFVLGATVEISIEIAETLLGNERRYIYSQYTLDKDGTPVRFGQDNNGVVRYFTLAGEVIGGQQQGRYTLEAMPMAGSTAYDPTNSDAPRSQRQYMESFQRPEKYLRLITSDIFGVRWSFVGDRKVLEGYDAIGNFIGSMGTDGFSPPGTNPKPFAGPLLPYYGTDAIATTNAAYWVDFSTRRIEKAFTASDNDRIVGFGTCTSESPRIAEGHLTLQQEDTLQKRIKRGEIRQFMLVVTQSRLYAIEGNKILFSLPPNPDHDYTTVNLGLGKGNVFHVMYNGYLKGTGQTELLKVSEQGVVLTRQQLPSLPPVEWTPRLTDKLPILFIPPAMLLIGWLINDPIPKQLFGTWIEVGAVATWVGVTALSWWICRRYAYGRAATLIWVIFTACSGVAGVLTLYFVRTKPARLACPACGKMRVVSRENCEHCGAPFLRPAAPAIEIFETSQGDLVSVG